MKQLFILLALSGAALAQPTILQVKADQLDYAGVRVAVQLSAPPVWPYQFKVAYGTNPAALSDTSEYRILVGTGNWMMTIIPGFAPSTKTYIRVLVSSNSVDNSTWQCSGGAIAEGTLTGLTCEVGSAYPYLTSAANPGPWDVPYPNGTWPQQPTQTDTTSRPVIAPIVEGTNQFSVANDCSNLSTQITAAATAGATKNVYLMLPPNESRTAVCKWPTSVPSKTSSFDVIVRSSAGDLYFPPEGVRLNPNKLGQVAKLAYLEGSTDTSFYQPNVDISSGGGWRFQFVEFTHPDEIPTSDTGGTVGITSIVTSPSTWTINFASPFTYRHGNVLYLEGVPNDSRNCHTGYAEVTYVSSTQAQAYCPDDTHASIAVRTISTAGMYASKPIQRIESVTPGSGICSGGTLVTLNSSLRLATGTGLVITIRNANIAALNRTWYVTVQTATTACLDNSSSVTGTYTSNSAYWGADNGTWLNGFVSAGTATSKVIIDRCYLHGREFPSRVVYGVRLFGSDSGMVDSYMDRMMGWEQIDPGGAGFVYYATHHFRASALPVVITFGQKNKFDNNYIEYAGINFFAEEGGGAGPVASDITITRNTIVQPEKYRASSPESNGLYSASRHLFELKRGVRVLFSGNDCTGNWADDVATGSSVALTIRGGTADITTGANEIRDVEISRNRFRRYASGINITGFDDVNMSHLPVKRIAIWGNVFSEGDYFRQRSVPNSVNYGTSLPPETAGGGLILNVNGGIHSFVFGANTVYDPRGISAGAIFTAGKTSHWVMTRNLLMQSKAIYVGLQFQYVYNNPALTQPLPAVDVTNVGTAWPNYARNTSGPDPYSFISDNWILPGVETPVDYRVWEPTCYAATNGGCNLDSTELDAVYGSSTGTYTKPTYLTGSTANARIAQAGFANTTNLALKPTSSLQGAAFGRTPGYDGLAVDQARGSLSNARALDVATTTAKIGYSSYSACTVKYGTGSYDAATPVSVAASATDPRHVVSLTSLTSGTLYNWWVDCPSEQASGTFRTQ